jgi:catechol 2,3-dioxygenase-like lactoylglutathione lyase family enzyme
MNLNQVTIPVSNVARSINFYQKLGLNLIVAESHYARFECPGGDSTFSLHQADGTQNGNGAWIYFEVQDLDNYVEELLATGIKLEELPTDKTWLWRESRLKDPDNNQLIIYFAGKNRRYPPWRLI